MQQPLQLEYSHQHFKRKQMIMIVYNFALRYKIELQFVCLFLFMKSLLTLSYRPDGLDLWSRGPGQYAYGLDH